MKFNEFVNKTDRESRRELGILSKVLVKNGLQVSEFLEAESPYIFVRATNEALSFEGIRIYKIGKDLAYRVQKEDDTQPYGKAYPLSVTDMYNDLVSDQTEENKAGHEIMEAVAKEIKKFFERSAEAEKELRSFDIEQEKDPMGKVVVASSGSDYSSNVFSKGN